MDFKIEKINYDSSDYPEKLRNIPNSPKCLYCTGNLELLNSSSVAVVGSRKNTIYGKKIALLIGKTLAKHNIPVVSGLAYGIDSYAHIGSLDEGGHNLGVLGSGIKKMTPKKNFNLMIESIEKGGLIISEYEPEKSGTPYTFPARNRIISGISDIVVVVEASYNSGSLITAQHALEQGKTIYAVPGNIDSQYSHGCNLLIRDGAAPLVIVEDIINEINKNESFTLQMELDISDVFNDDVEEKIYKVIQKCNGITADKIEDTMNINVSAIIAKITMLEIKGLVEVYAGKIYIAKQV